MRTMLALDCATKTGWSTWDLDTLTLTDSGHVDLAAAKPGLVFRNFNEWLKRVVREEGPILIVFEEAHHRGKAATLMGVGLASRVIELADTLGIDRAGVHTGALKLWATGYGKAKKPAMMDAAFLICGKVLDSDDESDAILLGAYYCAELFGTK